MSETGSENFRRTVQVAFPNGEIYETSIFRLTDHVAGLEPASDGDAEEYAKRRLRYAEKPEEALEKVQEVCDWHIIQGIFERVDTSHDERESEWQNADIEVADA